MKRYVSFSEFYPFYLSQHSNKVNRALHVIGSVLSLLWVVFSVISHQLMHIPGFLLIGYGFAWIGHFFFEKNRPATFKYPLYSFIGDLRMAFDVLTFRLPFHREVLK